jgi:hypothetical protein
MHRKKSTLDSIRRRYYRLALVLLVAALQGCASFKPLPSIESLFLERAQRKTLNNVEVTVAVPSSAEARQIFGVDLYRYNIQPVYIHIDNQDEKPIWFLPVGVDPMYYTPHEAAYIGHSRLDGRARDEMVRYFFSKGHHIYVHPGMKRSGYVFTNLDEGTKSFALDLIGEDGDVRAFTFFIPVPGLTIDHRTIDFEALYPADAWRNADDEENFIQYLQTLPCCTANKKGTDNGDPLNLIVIGDGDDVYHAFLRAGWDETEIITARSLWKTAIAFFSGGAYRYSPVSSLYVFGRSQDIALQKARQRIHERNHLRLWLAPVKFKGKHVWVGQISRDIGVRWTRKTIVTHKIDPDVDETRGFLIQDLWYSQGLERFALVGGAGAAPIQAPRHNLTGDPYFTDGLRAVLWNSSDPVPFETVQFVEWEQPS